MFSPRIENSLALKLAFQAHGQLHYWFHRAERPLSFLGSQKPPFRYRPTATSAPFVLPLANRGLRRKPWDFQSMILHRSSGVPGMRAQSWCQESSEAPQIWAIRFFLDRERRLRDRALFDLAIDSKRRGCAARSWLNKLSLAAGP